GVVALDAGRGVRWPPDEGRSLVVRFVPGGRGFAAGHVAPRLLELGAVPLGAVAGEEVAVVLDAAGDRLAGFDEDRAPFAGVAVEQRRLAPSVEERGELPAEVDRVLKPGVGPVAPVGRPAVRRAPGDERAARQVRAGAVAAQAPDAAVLQRTAG